MTTLADIAEKMGEVRADVRASREDIAEVKAGQDELGERLSKVELGLAQVHTRAAQRRFRERLVIATTLGVLGGAWGLLAMIPGRVWIAAAQALGQ